MGVEFVDMRTVVTRQTQMRRDVSAYVAPLPQTKRSVSVPPAKSGHVISDFGHYEGQKTSHYAHVLLSRELRNNTEIIKRYANLSQKAITRYRKADGASKSLAVYARKGNARVLVGICDVFSGDKIVWHDVTVTGAIADGRKLDGATNKLRTRAIVGYVKQHTPKRMHPFIDGLAFYSVKVR